MFWNSGIIKGEGRIGKERRRGVGEDKERRVGIL
jgi:hypothetical protein